MTIRVLGAGVAGLTCAYELAQAGATVEIVERASGPGLGCSFHAGGMIAPWCEEESAEPLVVTLGREALEYWTTTAPAAAVRGTLVIAPPRDRPDLLRFARLTSHHEKLGAEEIATLEPDLAGRFDEALFFSEEAHLDPRQAMAMLAARLREFQNVVFRFNTDAETIGEPADWTIDCRGFAARDALSDLRGVKGEMLVLETRDVSFARPIRMLHPRHPVYIVPRGDGRFMIGATMIESEERSRVTARSVLELLSAVYAIHPAFGEAEIVETGSDVRPAFPDNLPRLRRIGRTLYVNGLYRHGFLLAPALARRAAAFVLRGEIFPEVMDADPCERQRA
ncbi:MAG: FAD-dependent oxidoreductase [Methylovirgula sp.]|jgi:glycine oxidase